MVSSLGLYCRPKRLLKPENLVLMCPDGFGLPGPVPIGPAALAVDTGAPLFPGTLWYEGPLAYGRIHDPLPVPEVGDRAEKIRVLTQGLARVYEQGIRDHPTDWHMLSRVWIDDASPQGSPPA